MANSELGWLRLTTEYARIAGEFFQDVEKFVCEIARSNTLDSSRFTDNTEFLGEDMLTEPFDFVEIMTQLENITRYSAAYHSIVNRTRLAHRDKMIPSRRERNNAFGASFVNLQTERNLVGCSRTMAFEPKRRGTSIDSIDSGIMRPEMSLAPIAEHVA